ncbi:hypothetical protein BS47DRAFT_1365777 [Hydnum rufescens UP504]|uniref:Uncharacterized protein n=1 Tax=Hydnum rufescens UP504 TaxID=1448309 RepID=A0A9P6DSK0_9AGAM|nr:hypothetical protein BS47DRAFT_1365777 [Hydnum rufescens UP504]
MWWYQVVCGTTRWYHTPTRAGVWCNSVLFEIYGWYHTHLGWSFIGKDIKNLVDCRINSHRWENQIIIVESLAFIPCGMAELKITDKPPNELASCKEMLTGILRVDAMQGVCGSPKRIWPSFLEVWCEASQSPKREQFKKGVNVSPELGDAGSSRSVRRLDK